MSEATAETTSSAKDSKPDCASCPMASSEGSDKKGGEAGGGAGRGERQKSVTRRYRNNWDGIFGKKSR